MYRYRYAYIQMYVYSTPCQPWEGYIEALLLTTFTYNTTQVCVDICIHIYI